MTAFPLFTGVAVKVYAIQGPPLLGEVAVAVAVMGEVAAAATSHDELRSAQHANEKNQSEERLQHICPAALP